MRARMGFTLIEVLAATLLTSIVISAAVAFFITLTDATTVATDRTREGRHAVAVLDRIARDLESSFLLVKPPDRDPIEHPWLFLAEDRYASGGADRLKFVTYSPSALRGDRPSTSLSVVAYWLRRAEDDRYELLRWSSPGLPEQLERDFPSDEDNAMVLAEGLTRFSVRFLDEDGQWASEWDSSTVLRSSDLPVAAEVRIALSDESEDADLFSADAKGVYSRGVMLPVRPIDLTARLEEGAPEAGRDEDAEGADSDCVTVSACIEAHSHLVDPDLLPLIQEAAASQSDICASESSIPFASYGIQCE